MAFVEIKPVTRTAASRTGVVCSLSEKWGLMVTISGDALAALGAPARVRCLLDWQAVEPLLLVIADDTGPFGLRRTGRGQASGALRVGRRDEWKTIAPFKAIDCVFETATRTGGARAIEIELPRELRPQRPVESVRVPGTTKQVSLAKV